MPASGMPWPSERALVLAKSTWVRRANTDRTPSWQAGYSPSPNPDCFSDQLDGEFLEHLGAALTVAPLTDTSTTLFVGSDSPFIPARVLVDNIRAR